MHNHLYRWSNYEGYGNSMIRDTNVEDAVSDRKDLYYVLESFDDNW